MVDVESLVELDRRLAGGARRLGSWRVHRLDLTAHGAALRERDVRGAGFLGCSFADGDDDALAAGGAVVLPEVGSSPLDVYRPRLYTADELYDRIPYSRTLDARGYAWAQRTPDRDDALAAALHDHAVDQALARFVAGQRVVGVMGGHALARDTPAYADAARLGWALGRALGGSAVVATGGGPGAMEAANLGGRLAGVDSAVLDASLTVLAQVPSYRPSIDAWVASARAAVDDVPDPRPTLGVPTWHYGHEPPNLFATAIAKYVANATREAVLLEICDAGIVFLPGAAGTVQEVFQDACENYYAEETGVAPMVLLGRLYWTDTVPVWPLLQSLARGRAMEQHVHLVDTVDEAAAVVAG